MGNDSIFFSLENEIGIIKHLPNGWNKELNIVAWNGNAPKYDIRDWTPDHEKMSRGITLTKEEVKNLYEILKKEFESEV